MLTEKFFSTFYELQCGNRIGCLLVSGQKLVLGTYVGGGSGGLDIVVGTELGLEHAPWALALHTPAVCHWECHSPRGGNKHLQLFSGPDSFYSLTSLCRSRCGVAEAQQEEGRRNHGAPPSTPSHVPRMRAGLSIPTHD